MKKITFDHLQELYDKKNADYGNAYKKFGVIMEAIFPQGLILHGADTFVELGLFVQLVEKVIRIGNLSTNRAPNFEPVKDSCDDLAVVAQIFKTVWTDNEITRQENI